MNIEIKSTRDIETDNHQQQAIGKHDDAARSDRTNKPNAFIRPIFVITGVALYMGLVSCIEPYDSNRHGHTTAYRPGYRIDSLPSGYRSENISGSTYYYHDGCYYRPESGGYVVVDAPRNSRYYDDYSRRQHAHQPSRDYQDSPNRHDGRYDRGEVITRLPDGYRVVNHRGETYYQVGDRYYRRQGETYVITTRPY